MTDGAEEGTRKRLIFQQAVLGAQAYLKREPGNSYTKYLQSAYGDWSEEQSMAAEAILCDKEPHKSFCTTSTNLIWAGTADRADYKTAAENQTIQTMHPSRQRRAVRAVLSYTYHGC